MVTYEINEAKRTVVAHYKGGTDEVKTSIINTLSKFTDWGGSIKFGIDIEMILKPYENRFDLIGKARCHEEDTFDVEKGKQLALNRLNRKFAVLRKDIIRNVLTRLNHLYLHTVHMITQKL